MTLRQRWDLNRDDPIWWTCWIGGCLAVGLLVLMPRLYVIWAETSGFRPVPIECPVGWTDPRCVRWEQP